MQWKELEQFLLDRAMEHDTPSLLFQQAVEHLQAAQVVRPGVVTLMELVTAARAAAGKLTTQKVGHLLTRSMRAGLDGLLLDDPEIGTSRLRWLTTPAVEASVPAIGVSVDKLLYLREMDAHRLDLSMLPRERRRFLATVARRSTVQGLERRAERRYPILLSLVAQSAVDQLDEVIALFDQAVSARESYAKAKTDEALAERAKRGEARQLLMDLILPVLNDPGIADEEVGGLLRDQIGLELCVVLALRDGLRSGDVFVPGSRRYADPGHLPVHPGAVGGQAGGVLPAGPQARHRVRGDRPGQERTSPGVGGTGGDLGECRFERRGRGPPG
ncbi:DUF4158 domain-containing protein [Streptosporangium sp. NPDC049046]|uniref:DUF4158 domain-containing protein n=1 Tax=Streptosporangium sp. NPDC049046 TaxID=3155031 RepID=UPI00342E636F